MGLVDINTRDRFDMPHEAGHWFELRPLRATEIDEAKDRATERVLDKVAGHVDVIKALSSDEEDKARRAASEDDEVRASTYDAETVLKYAVVGLSYREDLRDMSKLSPGQRADVLADLDFETRKVIHIQAVKLNTRPPTTESDSSASSSSLSETETVEE